ncbi:MAG: histidinol dehydrogenase [Chitinophagaceae bacterium]|nr:histidinol dehydrogenase [Chitinophagaceae bacterium]
MKLFIEPQQQEWDNILKRPTIDLSSIQNVVTTIVEDVKTNGDLAIKKYTQQFDGVLIDELAVTQQEMDIACAQIDEELKTAIAVAKENIWKFHSTQKESIIKIETSTGVLCWRESIAIEKVGLYIPGGIAPLFSTLLMLGIPALIAGCKEIIVCTPPDKLGNIHPAILYVANILGIKKIFKLGGVQAIAAMAFGTKSIPKVHKIFGPGNQYVTVAKQLINSKGVAIDMPAGPSEVAIYADDTCVPKFVAADLLSQAEHGVDSQVVLVARTNQIVEEIKDCLQEQIKLLPRKDIAQQALQNSLAIVIIDANKAFDLLNEYAPEHLIISSDAAEQLAEKIVNAGSVFLGNYSPESAGDYASGTNHTLPTNGFANAYSGVSLDSFYKKITFQKINKTGLKNIGKTVEVMAEHEGLQAHKNAISIRLQEIDNNEI